MTHRLPFSLFFVLALSVGACASAGGDGDSIEVTGEHAEASLRGSFDVWQTGDQWYFHLAAANHATLLTSEGYQSRTSALGGVLSVLDNGGLETRYEIRAGADGQHYVNLKAANGRIIATSEGYSSASNAERAVGASVRAIASYLEHWATADGARFQVFEGADQQFYFNLHAKNGAIVLSSEGYTTEASALNGAFSVAENGIDEGRYQLRAAAHGGVYLVLRAKNNRIIATSEVYASKGNAERARDSIIELLYDIELL